MTSVATAKQARRQRRDRAPGWMDEIRDLERGDKLAHLRDVWVADEDAAANLVWQMQSMGPVFQDFFDDQAMWHNMGLLDQEQFGKLTQAFPGPMGSMREIGRMPLAMLTLLWAQDSDFLHDRERLYRFLRKHREYSSPGAPTDPSWITGESV